MNCAGCKKEINFEGLEIITNPAAHDNKLLDVVATCNQCGQPYNVFIRLTDLVALNHLPMRRR